MVRTLISSALLGLALAGQAGAVTTVVVDNFDDIDMFVSSTTIGAPDVQGPFGPVNGPGSAAPLARTLTHVLVSGPNGDNSSYAAVGPTYPGTAGTLEISNPPGVGSDVSVAWTLPGAFIPGSSAGAATLRIDLVSADLNTTAKLYYDGAQISSTNTFAATATTTPVFFALSAAEQNAIHAGIDKVLRLDISGPRAYDIVIDNVGFQLSPVPEPGTAAMLFGGGLFMVGVRLNARRRRFD